MELNNTEMKPKHLAILNDCIEHGCRYGVSRAFKSTEEPSPEQIEESVHSAIVERIHQFYDFTSDVQPQVGSNALSGVAIAAVGQDTANYVKGSRITLMREDGKTFSVNVPDLAWGSKEIYGLNMVFDDSGEGDHYI